MEEKKKYKIIMNIDTKELAKNISDTEDAIRDSIKEHLSNFIAKTGLSPKNIQINIGVNTLESVHKTYAGHSVCKAEIKCRCDITLNINRDYK